MTYMLCLKLTYISNQILSQTQSYFLFTTQPPHSPNMLLDPINRLSKDILQIFYLMTEQTIFDKLIRKEIPSKVVYEDEHVFAFRDIAPVAPTHIIIIPKHKDGLTGLSQAQQHHEAILGKLLIAASKIAKQENLEKGYRIVINNGEHAGQTVWHIHVHLLGGNQFTWPPGTSL